MTAANLFQIILKVLGLLFLRDIVVAIPDLFSGALYLTRAGGVGEGLFTVLFTLLTLSFYAVLAWLLLFRSALLIRLLQLDRGLTEPAVSSPLHRSTILSISVIVIGGVILIDQLPVFFRQLFIWWQERQLTYLPTKSAGPTLLQTLVKVVLGFLVIYRQRVIVNFIEYRRKK